MRITNILLFTLLVIAAGCRPSTQLTATWQAPELGDAPYGSIFLAATIDDMSLRQNMESEFARRLSDRNITTELSTQVFRPDFFDEGQPSRERLVELIQETGLESILTINLIDEEREERYVRGGGGAMGPMFHPGGRFGYYGTFPGYYNHWGGWGGMGFQQGYYTTDRRFFMETNLYDAETMELVWSAQSRTLNPDGDAQFAREYVDKIKAELRENGLIR